MRRAAEPYFSRRSAPSAAQTTTPPPNRKRGWSRTKRSAGDPAQPQRADDEFVATVAEFPSLSWLEPDQIEAIQGLERLVASVVVDLQSNGASVPAPLADRTFSGQLNLRVSAQLHRRLATEALQHREGLNAYASSLLERKLTT